MVLQLNWFVNVRNKPKAVQTKSERSKVPDLDKLQREGVKQISSY